MRSTINDDLQVTTPMLFKLIPDVMNLGVLMHWFPSESSTQNEVLNFLSLSCTVWEKAAMVEVQNIML